MYTNSRPLSHFPPGWRTVRGEDLNALIDATNGALPFNSVEEFRDNTVPPSVNTITLYGYSEPGDGGGGLYRRVDDEPTHPGKLQDASHNWFELDSPYASPLQFRPLTTNMADAADDAAAYAVAKTVPIQERRVLPFLRSWRPTIVGHELVIEDLHQDFANMQVSGEYIYLGSPVLNFFTGSAPVAIGNLTADAVRGTWSVFLTPANAAKLAKDDLIAVWSNYNLTSQEENRSEAFMQTSVGAVNLVTGEVTVRDMIMMSRFTTAMVARVIKLDKATRVIVNRMSSIGSGINRNQRAVAAQWCNQNRVFNYSGTQAERGVWLEAGCWHGYFDTTFFAGVTELQQGYVLTISGAHGTSLGVIRGRRGRHYCNTAHGGPPGYVICSDNISIEGIEAWEAVGGIMDTHPGCGIIRIGYVDGGQAADADPQSSSLCASQGAGFMVNQVRGRGAFTSLIVLQSYGWRAHDDFKPFVQVGEAYCDLSLSAAVFLQNFTDRDNDGKYQEMIGYIGQLHGTFSNRIVALTPEDGPVNCYIGPGSVIGTGGNPFLVNGNYGYPARLIVENQAIDHRGPTRTLAVVEDSLGFLEFRGCSFKSNSAKIAFCTGGTINFFNCSEPTGVGGWQYLNALGGVIEKWSPAYTSVVTGPIPP